LRLLTSARRASVCLPGVVVCRSWATGLPLVGGAVKKRASWEYLNQDDLRL
jgi:hypothetical protein